MRSTLVTNRRILVIDDNRSIHEDFGKVLGCKTSAIGAGEDLDWIKVEMLGQTVDRSHEVEFELTSAFQGQEGLDQVRQAIREESPFALAFVDIRMPPGWDGIKTIAHLWQVDPDLEVVICSAHSDYGWDDIVRKLGSTDQLLVLRKPFDSVEVIQIAHALTRKWALQRAARLRNDELEDVVKSRTLELEAANLKLASEVAERRHMETELRLAQKLEAVGQLAAGIAHEINTPTQYVGDNTRFLQEAFVDLASVLQKSGELLEAAREGTIPRALVEDMTEVMAAADLDYLATEIPHAIEQSLEGVERVAKIVGAMKEFSHPGSDEKSAIDINRAIETTITVARNEWKYVAVMETDLDSELPPVPCLPGEFNQVILNIIVNAAQTIGETLAAGSESLGTISVCTRAIDDWVEVRISDTGMGIPESVQPRIFDPFYTTKDVGTGTGQGLAIVHAAVTKKHGGTVTFETEIGKGSTFIIRLPLEAATAESQEAGE